MVFGLILKLQSPIISDTRIIHKAQYIQRDCVQTRMYSSHVGWPVAVQLPAQGRDAAQDVRIANSSEQQSQRLQREEGVQGVGEGMADQAAVLNPQVVIGSSGNGNGSNVTDSIRRGRGQF